MTRPRAIAYKGSVERHSDAEELLMSAADCALVVRGVVRSLAIRCPDGCGELLTVNLDRRSGPAWRVYQTGENLTLYPSVWRHTGCESHFIIWNNRILWCDANDWSWDDSTTTERVRKCLPASDEPFASAETIAKDAATTPWEALWACHTLERIGVAVSFEKTKFRLAGTGRSPLRKFDRAV